MDDQELTKAELEKELSALRREVVELESLKVERDAAVRALQESEARYRTMAASVTEAQAGLEQQVEDPAGELREANQTLRALIQASPLSIAVLDRDGNLRSWNKASERMFGWSEEEAMAQLHPILSSDEQWEEALAGRRRILEGESIVGLELRRRKKDGSPIDVELWGAPLRDDHGELNGGVFIYADVTQRKQAEEDLREANQTLRALIEASPLAIGVLDRDRRLRSWNKAGEQIFGWTAAEAMGHSGPLLSPEENHDAALERQDRLLAGESLLGLELRHRRKDGSSIDVEVWAAPLRDTQGDISGSVVIYADITERQAAQEALRQAEEKYRSIFENSVEGIFQLSPKGQIISVNPALGRIFGFESIEEVTQLTRLETAYFHDLSRLIREQGSVLGYEAKEERQDGIPIWISISARAVYGQSGELAYYEGTVQDITEHKLAEEALQESEERYRNLVETAQDIIYTLSIDGTITSLNPAFEVITGLPRSEWIGKPVADLIHPDDLGPAADLVQRFSQGDRPIFERRVVTKSGEFLNCEFLTTPQMRDGTLIGVVGIGRDVTERKRAEEALRASEEEYRSLFNDSKDTIFVTARDGAITDVNQAALDLFGYTREEIIGRNASSLCVSVDDHAGLVQQTDTQGSVRDFEIKLKNKDGTEMDCLVTASLRRDSEGKVLAYQGVVRDVTERKLAEQTSLEQTRELAILEERNRFAREIHDTLAQGFTGIVLQLEAAEQVLGDTAPEVQGHMARAKGLARDSLQEARRSVWDLLPHALEQLPLDTAIGEEVRRRFDAKGSFSVSGEQRPLSSSVQTALLRICQEALTNISRHAAATRVSVKMVFHADAIHLEVRDDGVGFDRELSGSGHELGSGFGLIGMEQRARQLGGTIIVSSKKGQGTVVEAKIPTV